MNTDKIWLGAVTVFMAVATTGCTATTGGLPAASSSHTGGGGSLGAVAWYSDRPAPSRADHEAHHVDRARHGGTHSERNSKSR
jgi:hypothetical protein